MYRLTLGYVWKQKPTPVVLRRTGRGEKLRCDSPFADDNRQWLQNGRRTAPEWIGRADAYWELPKSWFNDFVDRRCSATARSTLSNPIASRRSARVRARKHEGMNASVLAWAPTMASAMMGACPRSPTPSTRWATASSRVACLLRDRRVPDQTPYAIGQRMNLSTAPSRNTRSM